MDLADLTRDLASLRDDALGAIAAADDVPTLEAIELDVLGKKGRLTAVLRGIGGLAAEDRPRVGAIANEVRLALEAALAARGSDLRGAALESRLRLETLRHAPGSARWKVLQAARRRRDRSQAQRRPAGDVEDRRGVRTGTHDRTGEAQALIKPLRNKVPRSARHQARSLTA